MNIVDTLIHYLNEHSTHNNNNYNPISRIKHKVKELAKVFDFIPADKAANTLRSLKRKARIHQNSN